MSSRATAKRTPGGAALTDLVLEIFKTNVELSDAGPAIARDSMISAIRWQLLNALSTESKTAAQVGREIGLTRQGALQNVQLLQELGYVTLEDNPEDRRAKKVALTPEGRKKLAEVNRYQSLWINQLATHFEVDEIVVATRVVQRLAALTVTSVSAVTP